MIRQTSIISKLLQLTKFLLLHAILISAVLLRRAMAPPHAPRESLLMPPMAG